MTLEPPPSEPSFTTVEQAMEEFRRGRMVILVDDEDRENEGDLAIAAEKVTPEFAMNMILNPQEMYTRHPDVKKLLGEYMTQMPNQGLTQEQAREVVEYLRTTTPPAPAQ